MDFVTLAQESVGPLVVLLVGLMQIRYWKAVLTYEAIIDRLREELAFAQPPRRSREAQSP